MYQYVCIHQRWIHISDISIVVTCYYCTIITFTCKSLQEMYNKLFSPNIRSCSARCCCVLFGQQEEEYTVGPTICKRKSVVPQCCYYINITAIYLINQCNLYIQKLALLELVHNKLLKSAVRVVWLTEIEPCVLTCKE